MLALRALRTLEGRWNSLGAAASLCLSKAYMTPMNHTCSQLVGNQARKVQMQIGHSRQQSDSHAAPAERLSPGCKPQLLGHQAVHGRPARAHAAHQHDSHCAPGTPGGEEECLDATCMALLQRVQRLACLP